MKLGRTVAMCSEAIGQAGARDLGRLHRMRLLRSAVLLPLAVFVMSCSALEGGGEEQNVTATQPTTIEAPESTPEPTSEPGSQGPGATPSPTASPVETPFGSPTPSTTPTATPSPISPNASATPTPTPPGSGVTPGNSTGSGGIVQPPTGASTNDSVPFRVVNGSGQARQEVVSLGVPYGITNPVTSTAGLYVVDAAGAAVPAQFRVLSRYGGLRSDSSKPIRVLLVTLAANVPANSTATYTVHTGGTATSGQIAVVQSPAAFSVATGPATFIIDRQQFRLFNSVSVSGQSVVTTPIDALSMNYDTGAAQAIVAQTDLEESGSVRTIVRQEGTLLGQTPLHANMKYVCRWTFESGRSSVKIDFQVTNENAYGHFYGALGEVFLDSLALRTSLPGASSIVSPNLTQALSAGQTFQLRQSIDPAALSSAPSNVLGAFRYRELLGTSSLVNGTRSHGALAFVNPTTQRGAIVATDRFWQNYPKEMGASQGANDTTISVALWPSWGAGPSYDGLYSLFSDTFSYLQSWAPESTTGFYRFEGARQKTHTITFDFFSGQTPSANEVSLAAERTNTPLAGLAEPSWIRQSKAIDPLFIERRQDLIASHAAVARWERSLDILVDDNAADQTPNFPYKIGYPKFAAVGGLYNSWPGADFGWAVYGNRSWGDGYSNNHYDLAYGLLQAFWRTGDYRFFDVGRDVATYMRDYGRYHSKPNLEISSGGAFYEKGWTVGNYRFAEASHTWVEGLTYFHWITGDEETRDTALATVTFWNAVGLPENWNGWWGSRVAGWPMVGLVSLVRLSGDVTILNKLDAGLANYESLEQADGGLGYILNQGANPPDVGPWHQAYVFTGGVGYAEESVYFQGTEDQTYKPLLQRIANWFLQSAAIPGSGLANPTQFTPPQVYYYWQPGGGGSLAGPVHHWIMQDALTLAAFYLNSSEALNRAAELYEYASRYYSGNRVISCPSNPVNLLNTNCHSYISYRDTNYPSSETKIHNGRARTGMAFTYLGCYLNGVCL